MSDRGRSPRREKEKSTLGPTYQSVAQPAPPPQQVAEPQQPCTSTMQTELEDTASGRINTSGSFYSYSAATAASLSGRRSAQEAPVSILSRGPGYPPSPGGSDSAEYEQPSCAHLGAAYLAQDVLPDPIISASSSRMKLFRPEDDDEEDVDFDDPDSYSLGIRPMGLMQPGISGCLIHGPCATVEPAPSVASSTNDEPSVSGSPYWLNDITWGRSRDSWDEQ